MQERYTYFSLNLKGNQLITKRSIRVLINSGYFTKFSNEANTQIFEDGSAFIIWELKNPMSEEDYFKRYEIIERLTYRRLLEIVKEHEKKEKESQITARDYLKLHIPEGIRRDLKSDNLLKRNGGKWQSFQHKILCLSLSLIKIIKELKDEAMKCFLLKDYQGVRGILIDKEYAFINNREELDRFLNSSILKEERKQA